MALENDRKMVLCGGAIILWKSAGNRMNRRGWTRIMQNGMERERDREKCAPLTRGRSSITDARLNVFGVVAAVATHTQLVVVVAETRDADSEREVRDGETQAWGALLLRGARYRLAARRRRFSRWVHCNNNVNHHLLLLLLLLRHSHPLEEEENGKSYKGERKESWIEYSSVLTFFLVRKEVKS